MKNIKQIIIVAIFVLSGFIANAQWLGTGPVYTFDKVGINTSSPLYYLTVNGNAGFNDYLYHNGDTDTRFLFSSDRIRMYTGNETLLDIYEGTQDYVKLGDGGDVDINLNNDLYIDGLKGYVGIGEASPSANLDIVSPGSPKLKIRTTGSGTNYTSRIEMSGTAQVGNISELNFINCERDCDLNPDASIRAYSHSAPDVADLKFYTANGGALTQRMIIKSNGNIGVGTNNPTALFTVNGKIDAEEVEVKNVGADYVFEDDYNLMSIGEVEQFIKNNKHLPGIAPAEITEQGVELSQFTETLLEKVEELTLYIIQLEKRIKELEK